MKLSPPPTRRLPTSVCSFPEMYSPEKLRDALMNKMSLEDRESLLIDEGWRRKTFLDSAWPHNTNGITPATMARTGLYYTGGSLAMVTVVLTASYYGLSNL